MSAGVPRDADLYDRGTPRGGRRLRLKRLILALMAPFAIGLGCAANVAADSYTGARTVYFSPASEIDRVFQVSEYPAITPSNLVEEFIGYLDQIDSAAWTFSEDPFPGSGILLALTESPLVAVADKAQLGSMTEEAYLLDAEAGSIRLVGNSVLALQHALFDLLERLGCRFLTPSAAWTIVPADTGLSVAAGKHFVQPDFVSRRVFISGGDGNGWHESLTAIHNDLVRWNRRTRMGAYAPLNFGHTWSSIISRNAAEFWAHPEYFRCDTNGVRQSLQWYAATYARTNYAAMHFCPSNPGLQDLCAADRTALLGEVQANYPTERLVSMDPNDGHAPCYCADCVALGNNTDRVYHLANHVAREIVSTHPEGLVGIYSYSSFSDPPLNEMIESNLVINATLGFRSSTFSLEETIAELNARGLQTLGLYPYYGISQWDHGLPSSPPTFPQLTNDFPIYKSRWAVSFLMAEGSSSWGRQGPPMYLLHKLLWNAHADAAAIYDDFFQQAFGAGAGPMRALYDLWDDPHLQELNRANLARWLQQLDRARLATDEESPAIRRRIEDIMAYVHLTALFLKADEARHEDEATFTAAMKAMFTFAWRTRQRQIVSIWAFLYPGFVPMTWLPAYTDINPQDTASPWHYTNVRYGTTVWQEEGEDDYPAAEIRAFFGADLQEYSDWYDRNVVEFSRNLVPLFPAAAQTPAYGPSHAGHQTPSRWYLLIEEPTPVTITFDTWLHSTFPAETGKVARAILTDAAGTVLFSHVQSQYIELFPQLDRIDVELAPGLYALALNLGNANSSCRPRISPAVKHAFEMSTEILADTYYLTPGYFYVPRGTEEVRIDLDSGYLTVKAPSWPSAQIFNSTQMAMAAIPVGDDDAKVWELHHVSTGRYQFLNVPPYLATAKRNMLVPAEVLQPPLVDAGPDQIIALPQDTVSLDGTLTDTNDTLATTWTLLSGPGPVTFGSATNEATTATFPLAGQYVLQLAADNGYAVGEDTVTVTVHAAPGTRVLSYLAGSHGSISGLVYQVLSAGADGQEVAAVTNSGYYFLGWSDGSTANPRIDTNVQQDVFVTAAFSVPGGGVFDNESGDGLWGNPVNWSTDVVPTFFGNASVSGGDAEIASIDAVGRKCSIGNGCRLTITSGSLTTSAEASNFDFYDGTLAIRGGSLTVGLGALYVGLQSGTAVVEMTGGLMTLPSLSIPHPACTGGGTVHLAGGEINVTGTIYFYGNGVMDITGSGVFRFSSTVWGNPATKLNALIASGDIITSGPGQLVVTSVSDAEATVHYLPAGDELPFVETFEPDGPMAGVPGPVDGQHGWTGDPGAVVQDSDAYEFHQAACLSNAVLTHTFSGAPSNVWMAFAWKPTAGDPGATNTVAIDASTVEFWVDANGLLAANSNQTVVATGTVVDTGRWSRVLVHSDYVTRQWRLWLDGTPVIDGFGVHPDSPSGFTGIAFRASGGARLYLDDVRIGTSAWSPSPGDTDGDGMADEWERGYWLSPNVSDGTGDWDGDGQNDWNEALAGTDPTDGVSSFRITHIGADDAGTNAVLRWTSAAGRLYGVWWTPDPRTAFTPIAAGLPATPPENTYTDTVHGAESKSFYRIDVRVAE